MDLEGLRALYNSAQNFVVICAFLGKEFIDFLRSDKGFYFLKAKKTTELSRDT